MYVKNVIKTSYFCEIWLFSSVQECSKIKRKLSPKNRLATEKIDVSVREGKSSANASLVRVTPR